MNLKNWFLIMMVLGLATSCATSQEIRIIKEAPEKMYFDGFSLLTPNEKGWFYEKNYRTNFSLVAHRNKDGVEEKSTDENYVLRASIMPLPNFEKDEDLFDFVKEKLINNQYRARINMLERYQEPFKADGKTCIHDYFRGIDSGAKRSSGNTDLMILEVMKFVCHHPNENAALFFAYSFRYYPANKDSNLKEKALAVLKNIELAETKEATKRELKEMAEKDVDGFIKFLKHSFFTI